MSGVTPFVVARAGLPLAGEVDVTRIDPLRLASAPLLAAVARLDARPRWAIFDCAELPGAVVGLADATPAPLGLVAATPMIAPGHWLFSGLTSVDAVRAPLEALLDLALRVLAPSRVTATAGWGSRALAAFAARGPLRLVAAWLPAHTVPATCVFELAPAARVSGAVVDDGPLAAQRAIETGARLLLVATGGGGVALATEVLP